ncbi:hypothetical protein [Fulvivirga imtechensis]|nr:hypothetical protein [Fulvivirga imtechensis]
MKQIILPLFSSGKNMCKGSVSQDAFKLKENHHVFDSSYNDAVITGQITGNEQKTEVHV